MLGKSEEVMTKLLYFVWLTGSKKCVWLCLNSCLYQADIDLSNINILMLMDILLQVDYMQWQDTPNHYKSFVISDHNFAKIVKDDLTLSKWWLFDRG